VSRKRLTGFALLAILLAGAAFRFYNLNWDEGTYHIHPDERHTTMVVTRIRWPGGLDDYVDCRQGQLFEVEGGCAGYLNPGVLGEYFDTSHSLLNARNVDTVYFYGTLPLFLTKAVGTLGDLLQLQYAQTRADPDAYLAANPSPSSYDQIHLIGRVLSALFDLGTVLLTFFLARRLFDWRVAPGAAFLLAFTVLNIQGAHYFAVDTFLTFFVALTLWFTLDVVEGHGWRAFANLGWAMGLTMACKVSVFLLVAVVALAAWLRVRRRLLAGAGGSEALGRVLGGLALAVAVAFLVFRVAQPYAWAGPNYDGWEAVPAPWGERLEVLQTLPEPIQAVFLPNPQWVADIASAGAQQTGEADLPWGRQWTERTPWLWPLENMVLWTLGVPLGVTSWLGVALVSFLLFRIWWRRRTRLSQPQRSLLLFPNWDLILIPLAWVLLSFGWQGMQFVKSVRYFMPIHPYLAIFAAYLVVTAWDRGRVRGRGLRIVVGGLAGVVLLGTFLWALAFIQIYTQPVTRVQATHWIYENVESGTTLLYRTAEGQEGQIQLPVPSEDIYISDGSWHQTPFVPPENVTATGIVMNDLSGLDGPVEGIFEVQITGESAEDAPLASGHVEGTFAGKSQGSYTIDIPDVDLEGGQTYWFESRAVQGAPLASRGAVIANEHFDDPLPFNLFGYSAFGGGLYRSLDLTYPNGEHADQLPLYNEDTPEKLEMLLDALDQADYIIMSSGRLWQSIPRLPMRYPMTTRYYELLFAGELGFEKVAEFHAYPRLLGIEFDDTWAEEQFTVYDHPKVLIYKKIDRVGANDRAPYDRERVRALLSAGIDWASIPHWLNPRDVPKWRREQAAQQRTEGQQNDLMLTTEQQELQQQGGTWASIFDRNSLPNRWPTFSWLVLLGLVGLAALPLVLGIFHWLPDRGYILARPVGVLLLAWLSWILTNLTPLHYSRGTILLSLGLIAAISYGSLLLPRQRRRLADLWRRQKRLILVNELLFLAFFALFWIIRWGNPDLWHPWRGGEKPMDFAYLNAVIKSTEFPPYDPWFAGGYLNYYYFGQVMVGTLIKLVGIVPNVAYNLVIPAWFAMTAMGAFSLTYNLVAGDERQRGRWRRALVFGLLGALFVAVLGNLGEIHLVLLKAGEGVAETFQSTIPGLAGLVRTVIGSFELLFGGKALPIRVDEWYWNASRAIPAGPYESVITEFPFFTFLYADLHAHLIAMPLTFVSLAVALALARRGEGRSGWRAALGVLPALLLWALTIGAMRTTNTWDVPPHLLVVLGALSIAAFAGWRSLGRGRRSLWRPLFSVAWQFALVFVLAWSLLYRPFWANYGAYYDSVLVWTGTRTPVWAYMVVHGLFLFAIVTYLAAALVGGWRRVPLLRRLGLTLRYWDRRDRLAEVARWVGARRVPGLFWLVLVLLVLLEVFFLVPGLVAFTRADADAVAAGTHAYRGLAVLGLGLPLAIAGLFYLFQARLSASRRVWAYLVLLALAMTLGVEVIVIEGDIGRMNTVFKFYLQAWLMWGVTAAAALAWLVPWIRQGLRSEAQPVERHDESGAEMAGARAKSPAQDSSAPMVWRKVWLGILVALMLFAALYPPLATSAKVRDRFDTALGPGLDGWEYMETASYWDPVGEEYGRPGGVQYDLKWDLEAIRWLLDHVVGSPVILEGHAPEYRWGGRYSINTGLPTVLGWNWHQRQQRAAANQDEVWTRATEVATVYNAAGTQTIEPILDKYDVRYLVVGPLERAYYDERGLAKFETMVEAGSLRVAFSNEGVTIYEVAR
jgi:YYY domain-containing protein